VAQSRRRNRNVEENLEEVIDGSADTDALDSDSDLDDLDTDEVDEVDEDEVEASESRADRKARKAREKAAKRGKDGDDGKDVKLDLDETPLGIFGRFGRFVREVVAELRKVIWPNRKDLLVYATVVILFVAFMMTLVGGLDWAFARAVLWVFSGE